jgi:TatD DNase family protein
VNLTDTHCHLDFNKFDEDRQAVIQRARDAGLTRLLIPALDLESSRAAVELARAHPDIFAAVGFHPTDLDKWKPDSIAELKELITSQHVIQSTSTSLSVNSAKDLFEDGVDSPRHRPPGQVSVAADRLRQDHITDKIVAIGEIGLDYYWVKEPEKQAQQRNVLKEQLRLAEEVNKPVVIHMREENDAWFGTASVDLLEILSAWCGELRAGNHPLVDRPGVLHSFNGNLETAQKAIALNFYIGVTGPVTYKNAEVKRQIIRQLPLERLLIETDSPFLTPVPYRGKRNEPAFVAHIADKIAEIHLTTREQIAEITSSNAARLFGWGG